MIEIEKKAEENAIKKSCKRCNKLVCDYPSEYCKWYKSVFEIAKENEELKKDKEYLDKVNNEQTEVILKLNEQNEKMKCCENCKLYDCTVDCKHTKCKYQYSKMCRAENMIDKWELAE